MNRPDMSGKLVHWTKGKTYDEAFDVLCRIVGEGRLLGGTANRFGGHPSISFTEAPAVPFHSVEGMFKPFGVEVSKQWFFSRGGRPVIYQPATEAHLLHESVHWRHVTYDPLDEADRKRKGYTWQREWRCAGTELPLQQGEVRLLLPDDNWIDRLRALHDQEEEGWAAYVNAMLGGYYEVPTPFPFDAVPFDRG